MADWYVQLWQGNKVLRDMTVFDEPDLVQALAEALSYLQPNETADRAMVRQVPS